MADKARNTLNGRQSQEHNKSATLTRELSIVLIIIRELWWLTLKLSYNSTFIITEQIIQSIWECIEKEGVFRQHRFVVAIFNKLYVSCQPCTRYIGKQIRSERILTPRSRTNDNAWKRGEKKPHCHVELMAIKKDKFSCFHAQINSKAYRLLAIPMG